MRRLAWLTDLHLNFVTPGHVQPDVERVIEQHRVYWVVEKFGEAAEVAEETDPRSSDGS